MAGLYEKGKIIREYRKMYALTQQDLAVKVNVSNTVISKIESGKYHPSKHLLIKIQNFLNITEFTDQENDHLSAQLSSWQIGIQQRNVTTSEHFYQYFKKIPISSFHNQKGLYYLLCFQHLLLQLRIEKAYPLLDLIKTELNKLSDKACYPFYKALGYFYVLTDSLKQARHYLNKAVSCNPDDHDRDGELHLYFALLYHKIDNVPYSMEHTSLAINLFSQQLHHPNLMLAYAVSAMNDLRLQKFDRGLKNIESILIQSENSLFLNMQALHFLLGIVHMQQQNYNKALQFAKNAVLHEKDVHLQQSYLYLVACIFAMMENKNQALSYIEAGLKVNANPKYQYKLLILREVLLENTCSAPFQHQLTEEIIPFFEEKEDVVELSCCYRLMGDTQFKTRNYKQSALYFQKVRGNPFITKLLTKYQPH